MSRSISDLILDLIPSYIEFFFQLIYLTLKSLYSEDGVFIRKKEDKTRFFFLTESVVLIFFQKLVIFCFKLSSFFLVVSFLAQVLLFFPPINSHLYPLLDQQL